MRRNPRDGLRARWIAQVVQAKVTGETRALLLYLAASMTDRGEVAPGSWDELADVFGVHKRRIAERFQQAQNVGLLDKVAGGWHGKPAVWQAVLIGAGNPHQSARDWCGSGAPKIRTNQTDESTAIGAGNPHHMTRVTTATEQLNERNSA